MTTSIPTASVLLLTYNQESLVAEALTSLLNQTFGPLEIVVSDDASTDGTWLEVERVARQYQGSCRFVLHRNERNLGIGANVQRAIELSSGDLIFLAAGDDISLPDRCQVCVDLWMQQEKKPDLIATDASDMGFNGELLGVKTISNLQEWSVERWFHERPFHVGASRLVLLIKLPHPQPASAANVLQAFSDQLNLITPAMRQSMTYD